MQRISTRSVDELVKAMGMTGISKNQVSRLCADIDKRAGAFPERPIEGDWPHLWLDATDIKVRQAGRIVSIAVVIAAPRPPRGKARSSPMKPSCPKVNNCATWRLETSTPGSRRDVVRRSTETWPR